MNEPTEVEKLQIEIRSLRERLQDAQHRAWVSDQQLRALNSGETHRAMQRAIQFELYYWIGKCQRQRQAINHIQKRGWYPPEYVIYEEPWLESAS